MLKKMLYLGIILSICISFLFAQTAIAPSAGDGTYSNPYQISTAENLYWISQNSSVWDKYFIQTDNINLSASENWNSGLGWTPIGNITNPFYGCYDGNEHIIDSLYIFRESDNYNGLFGKAQGGWIKNLGLTNVNITGLGLIGGLVGLGNWVTIDHCFVKGSINSNGMYIGGLTGYSSLSHIENCYTSGSLSGGTYVGGLCGRSDNYSETWNCYSRMSVSGSYEVGGLVGYLDESDIRYSYSTGIVSGIDEVGGLVGNSGSTGGGANTVAAGFWDYQSSSIIASSLGTGKTTLEMKTLSTYTGWDFTNTWDLDTLFNDGYPILKYMLEPPVAVEPSLGDGSPSDPFQIATVNHLYWLSLNPDMWGLHFIQTDTINMFESKEWLGGEGLIPIGNTTTPFSGTYNGQTFTIDHLHIIRSSVNNVGLFGYTNGAEITQVGLNNVNINGNQKVGGLAGQNVNSTVTYCYSNGSVYGISYCGGLIGQNESGIQNCHSGGKVEISSTNAGGLVGRNLGEIKNCYSTAYVTGGWGSRGGLVGYSTYTTKVIDSFWDKETSSLSSSSGGTGKTTLEMKTESTYTDAGWDFQSIWGIKNNIAEGYPHLYWQHPAARIKTLSVDKITTVNADVTVEVTYTGVPGLTEYGVCLAEHEAPTLMDRSVIMGTTADTGTYEIELTGLEVNHYYFLRAYVINEIDTSYGNEIFFRTHPVEPDTPDAGSGSETDPYQIVSLEQLYWIVADIANWEKHYVQMNDINASPTKTWFPDTSGIYLGWSPIGNTSQGFTGIYHGNGFIIDSLYINRVLSNNCAFFGWISHAEISGLGLTNVDIIGKSYVGSLAYSSSYSRVINCFASGNVQGIQSVGGLIGGIYSSEINNSFSRTNVNGIYDTGGLIGGSSGSSVINGCFSHSTVNGNSETGGLIGSNSATVVNCFSLGNVSGSSKTGGFIGSGGGTITNCYSAASVSGSYETGGFWGYGSLFGGGPDAVGCFWDIDVSGQTSSVGGEGKSTAEMRTTSTYENAGWDLINTWGIDALINNGYPYLLWSVESTPPLIETDTVKEITLHSANIQYSIIDLGVPTITQYGLCWNTTGEPTIIDNISEVGPADSAGVYTEEINGLYSNTIYHIRAYAINPVDTIYGQILAFKTLGLPEISNVMVSGIDTNKITPYAEITSLGNPAPNQHGFAWAIDTDSVLIFNKVLLGVPDSIGVFSSSIENLEPNSRYHLYAFASNVNDTVHTDTILFRTYGLPSISILTVSEIDSISITVGGQINDLGNPSITQHGFCWSTDINPTIEDFKVELGAIDSLIAFNSAIDSLTQNTRYYIRAFAINEIGTVYSDTLSFITLETSIFDMIPKEYVLNQNYSNPFNPTTTLQYGLPEVSDVKLIIFDIMGRKIREWSINGQNAGWHKLIWNGTDNYGNIVSTGVYIYTLKAGNFVDTKKMIFLK